MKDKWFYMKDKWFYIAILLGCVFVGSILTQGFSVNPLTGFATKELHPNRSVKVDFFVMSFCPFGSQAEEILKPVYDVFKNDVLFEPHFVIYSNYQSGFPNYCIDEENVYCSMHGISELNEGVRQLCIWQYYDEDTWWDYVGCINSECSSANVEECWSGCAVKTGVNVNKIQTCLDTEAIDLLSVDKALGDSLEVRGSPTLFFNGVSYQGVRSVDGYKQAICSIDSSLSGCSEIIESITSEVNGGCEV
ncbi:MAG: hypothetical protein GON13_02760 [Nanoarchaeota archaeon]|nr:hypothetical protein [Nanoarchaeota archaeon]